MTFASDGMVVIQPLYPYQGLGYTNTANDNIELDDIYQLYHMTIGKRGYYINHTAYGSVSWRSI
jgi:hypothetical protein